MEEPRPDRARGPGFGRRTQHRVRERSDGSSDRWVSRWKPVGRTAPWRAPIRVAGLAAALRRLGDEHREEAAEHHAAALAEAERLGMARLVGELRDQAVV